MVDRILWRKKVLLAKIETTYGTDAAATGAADAVLATNVTLTPMDGEDVERDQEFQFVGGNEVIPVGLRGVLKFDVELAGSGAAGTAPGWGPLLRACACAETIVVATSVEYSTIDPATAESATLTFQVGATTHKFTGARGTFELAADANTIPKLTFTLTGLFVDPAEAAALTPTLTAFKRPLAATKVNTPTFTIATVALVMRTFKLTLGNDVQPRLLVGRDEIIIPDRKPQIDAQVECVPLTTVDPFATAKDPATRVAFNMVHGTAAGNIVTIAAPTCQLKRPTGYQNNQGVAEWPLTLMPLPDSGNDELTITLT